MTTVSLPLPPRLNTRRFAVQAALALSLMLHAIVLLNLPWQHLLPDTQTQQEKWLDIQLLKKSIPTTEPEARDIQPEAIDRPIENTSHTESPPKLKPLEPTQPKPRQVDTVPPPPVTATPQEQSLDTWELRQKLLDEGPRYTPEIDRPEINHRHDPQQLPENWTNKTVPSGNSWMNTYLPSGEFKQEAWTEANGAIRQTVTTPDGVRLCGRAQPRDILQPLSFSIFVWNQCGRDLPSRHTTTQDPRVRPPPKALRQTPPVTE